MRCMRNLHRLLPRWRYQRRRKVLHRPRYLRFLRHLRRFLPQRCYHRGISFFLRHNTQKERPSIGLSFFFICPPSFRQLFSIIAFKETPEGTAIVFLSDRQRKTQPNEWEIPMVRNPKKYEIQRRMTRGGEESIGATYDSGRC